ncbi:MAG: MAPEG family protein, partial [Candidatus Marinimicrobia bacterium]|nr:MAPEG family protein [Candidatus Neomarinimicrobiota bacterium]
MNNQFELLTPVFVLILWTFIIFLIMAYGRVRFLRNPQDAAHTKNVKSVGPDWLERTVDNYNHLFEQPVAFYAVTLSIAIINNFDPMLIQFAWAFVFTRIMHSMVQVTFNLVVIRFILFVIGWFIIAYIAFSHLFITY